MLFEDCRKSSDGLCEVPLLVQRARKSDERKTKHLPQEVKTDNDPVQKMEHAVSRRINFVNPRAPEERTCIGIMSAICETLNFPPVPFASHPFVCGMS